MRSAGWYTFYSGRVLCISTLPNTAPPRTSHCSKNSRPFHIHMRDWQYRRVLRGHKEVVEPEGGSSFGLQYIYLYI